MVYNYGIIEATMNQTRTNTSLTSISVSEALQTILSYFAPLEPAALPIEQALGLVLAEAISSDIDLPPFDNSSMDGYAVRAEDVLNATEDNPARLRVTGYLPAGAAPGPSDHVEAGTAFRIMTGAPVPPGANAVVPFESTNEGHALASPGLQPQDARATPAIVGNEVLIYKGSKRGDYIRRMGEDVRRGEVVLRPGITIRPAEIAILASVGRKTVSVHRRPRVAVLATGDELVDIDQAPGPGQIRNTNNYAIAAQVASWGAIPFNLGVARDDREHLAAKLHEALDLQPDLLITSAGVSVGDYDIVKEVLMSLGNISVWRVRVKPGKPLAFGRLGEAGVPFLGLPGNPVSSMVSMELFGRPALMKMLGKSRLQRPIISVRAAEPLDNAGGREHYMRGIVTREADGYVAHSAGKQESNILTALSRANALLIVDEKTRRVEAGEPVRALMLDWPEEVF
jgi:molybdopterin molybdotransferase